MAYLTQSLNDSKLKLKNRLVYPPMATSKSTEDGHVSQGLLDYYDEKSRGGYVSLFIIEHSFISDQGKASKGQLSVADDSTIETLKKLSEVIHKNGSKAVMQINHAGSTTTPDVTGTEIFGPSAVIHPRNNIMPKELTKDEIKSIVNDFKDAALRVKAAGFDGVEIHSAHGYLLSQFFSPITNKRTDEYGGNVENRIRIHLEIIKAVKEAVGEDFPILLRLGGCDYIEGGATIEDSKIACAAFEKAGVDIIDISGSLLGFVNPNCKEQGYFSEITEAVKAVVSVPVILTGGITDVNAAENLLAEGKADLIGVGRAMLKDSLWAKNAIESLS